MPAGARRTVLVWSLLLPVGPLLAIKLGVDMGRQTKKIGNGARKRFRKQAASKRRSSSKVEPGAEVPKLDGKPKVTSLAKELNEALARQTASSDILRIISQSPTEVQPIFDAIVLAAGRLIGCDRSVLIRCDSVKLWQVALAGSRGLLRIVDDEKDPIDPDVNFPSRAIVQKKTLHLPNWSQIDMPPYERRIHERYGINSAL